MYKYFIWGFIALLVFGYMTNANVKDRVDHSARAVQNIQNPPSASVSTHKCAGCGTTRCTKFQSDYQEAVQRYDAQHRGLPRGLVLPDGKTVGEYVDADTFLRR